MNNHQIIEELLHRQSSGNLDSMLDLMSEDAVFELPFIGERMQGKSQIKQRMAPSIDRMEGLNFFDFRIRDLVDPGWHIAEFRGRATVKTTNRPYRQTYICVFHIVEQKVSLFQEYFGTLELAIACNRVEPVKPE